LKIYNFAVKRMKISNKLVGLIKGWLNIFIIYKEIYINNNLYIIILDAKL